MNEPLSIIEKQVKQFCARIGADPLLVQGPGAMFLGKTMMFSGSRPQANGLQRHVMRKFLSPFHFLICKKPSAIKILTAHL